MKRLMVFTITLAGLSVICPAQRNSRAASLKVLQLAEPKLTGPISLEEALVRRRSIRRFSGEELNFTQIGQLAWAGQGITDTQRGLRTAPSAGALYPITLYLATSKGLFVYDPAEHNLTEIFSEDIRANLAKASFGQSWVAQAGCNIIITGSERILAKKYQNMAKKYMLLEAGHVAQNILLEVVSLELGAVPIGAFDVREVNKICKLPSTLEPLYIISVGHPAPATIKEKKQIPEAKMKTTKKAALIIASENFRDEELFETKHILDATAINTVIVSSKTGPIKGMLGGTAEASITLNELNVDDYDAIIFVGGSGARQYFNDPVALRMAGDAANKGKVLAAICIAPTVLANAGVLEGVRATSFSSERPSLQKAGAQYTGAPIERDGLIITASGPDAARQFGRTIAEALSSK